MTDIIPIGSALISVYDKSGIVDAAKALVDAGVIIYSTGGTLECLLQSGINAISVEHLTGCAPILGGRVKTLHPKVFGGILARRSNAQDMEQLMKLGIPTIDLIITDLYPVEQTIKANASNAEIIEQIDIGGVSLIRACAKNYEDCIVISSKSQYQQLIEMLRCGGSTIDERKHLAAQAFSVTSNYDSAIFNYLSGNNSASILHQNYSHSTILRYGENPHQTASFFGNISDILEQLGGKEISYNNLLDMDAAMRLIADFDDTPTFAIIKHNNPCGAAQRQSVGEAYAAALAGDPKSAYGGILICNQSIDGSAAQEIDKLFFEAIIATNYDGDALELLQKKKNRIILRAKSFELPTIQARTLLNGAAQQTSDTAVETAQQMRIVTDTLPNSKQLADMIFANIVAKHCKSNAIVLAANRQVIGIGIGQTSRIDAVKQAILKASSFGFKVCDSVMASDGFFPFDDCVKEAHSNLIAAVAAPGGSIRDQDSIDFCQRKAMILALTGVRHFKH